MAILVTGGARSGKSAFAERYAAHLGQQGIYIATSHVTDAEMAERINKHRAQRQQSGFAWQTIEAPIALTEELQRVDHEQGTEAIVLVDCLTIWLSNVLFQPNAKGEFAADEQAANEAIDALTTTAARFRGNLILVTNEVGDGIVPAYASGRIFRDASGRMNQQIAAICDEVFLVTAGIPVELTRLRYRFD